MSKADQFAAIVDRLRPLHDDLALPDAIEIWRITKTRDSRNNIVETLNKVDDVRAQVEPANRAGRLYVAGAIEDQERLYVITLPYATDVRIDDEIRLGGRRFEVREIGQGGAYSIATEVVAQEVTP